MVKNRFKCIDRNDKWYDHIDIWFGRNIWNPIKDIRYWFLWRFSNKNKFNQIRPRTLKPGYYDQDHRMLHAVMELLCDYIDECEMCGQNWDKVDIDKYCKEMADDDNWIPENQIQQTRDQITRYKKLYDIREWWVHEYPLQHKFDIRNKLRPVEPEGDILMISEKAIPGSCTSPITMDFSGDKEAHDKWMSNRWKIDEEWEELIQRQLEIVVSLRKGMWV